MELTLVRASIETIELETAEDFLDMFPVIRHVFGEDEDIVEIDDDLATGNKVSKERVHHSLKRSGRVRQPKEHNHRFEESAIGRKRGLPFVTFRNPYIVVSPAHIKLGEDVCAFELIEQLLNEGQRVAVLDGHVVKFTVVLYRTKCAIFLLDEKER